MCGGGDPTPDLSTILLPCHGCSWEKPRGPTYGGQERRWGSKSSAQEHRGAPPQSGHCRQLAALKRISLPYKQRLMLRTGAEYGAGCSPPCWPRARPPPAEGEDPARHPAPPPALQPARRGLEGVTRSGRGRAATPEGSPVHRGAAAGASCAAAAGRSPRLPQKHSASFSARRKSVKGFQVQAAPAGGRLIYCLLAESWQGVRGQRKAFGMVLQGTAPAQARQEGNQNY